MVWVEQRKSVASVKATIGHHLVDIHLRNTLPWIVDPRGNPLPLGVYHLDHIVAPLHEDVRPRLKQAAPILSFQTEKPASLADDAQTNIDKRSLQHARDIRFE